MEANQPVTRLVSLIFAPPNLTDVFYRVNSVLPVDQKLSIAPADTTVQEALAIMKREHFSQLPVVEGGKVLGVFSYRSLSNAIMKLRSENLQFDDLRVHECLEHLNFVNLDDDLSKLIPLLNKEDAVLVGRSDQLIGIITAFDVLIYLRKVTDPFILISEIELALRRLIHLCLTDDQIRECAAISLKERYKPDKLPSALEDMTFDDYVGIIRDGRSWGRFVPVFGDGDWRRGSTRTRLEQVRDIRNDVFHFKREITEEDTSLLSEHREWLLEIATRLEAKSARRGGDQQ